MTLHGFTGLKGFTPEGTRLVTAGGQGLVGGNRLAVSPERLAAESAGLLFPRASSAESVAVRLVPAAGLPEDVVVVHESLDREHGLAERGGWLLRPAEAATADMVELESPAALALDEAAVLVGKAPLLCGHVFDHDEDGAQEAWIDLGGLPYRVRAATDGSGQRLRGLLRIGPDTRISVFAPNARSGVDVVVLADCSGSMGVPDIPDVRESASLFGRRQKTTVTRMDALKRALRAMIDTRMRVDGLVTRFALVGFDVEARTLFPDRDGMAEITGDDQRAVEDLRAKVTLLSYDNNRGTDIGRALHKAAELLHRHGEPGNERLIVLVSDGAHWTPMAEDRSGESVAGVSDPVSLMEDLHSGLGIRLHAVGISDRAMFMRYWEEVRRTHAGVGAPHQNLTPDHELLGELVTVAGGDRHRIGGVDVLEEYFTELGTGVVRSVGRPTRGGLPALQLDAEALASLTAAPRAQAADPARRQAWEAEVEGVLRQYAEVCEASRLRLGYMLFRTTASDLPRLKRTAPNRAEFTAWLAVAYKVFHERLPDELRYPKSDRSGLQMPELAEPLWDGRLGDVHGLRNYFLHDKDGEKHAAHNLQVGEAIRRYTGQYSVAEEDADGWHRLQQGLLRNVGGVLDDVYKILVAAPAPQPAAPEPGVPRLVTQGFGG